MANDFVVYVEEDTESHLDGDYPTMIWLKDPATDEACPNCGCIDCGCFIQEM